MEEVKQRNRIQHAIMAAGGGGVLGHGLVPGGIKGTAAAAALAGLGTYLVDDGDAWDTPAGPI